MHTQTEPAKGMGWVTLSPTFSCGHVISGALPDMPVSLALLLKMCVAFRSHVDILEMVRLNLLLFLYISNGIYEPHYYLLKVSGLVLNLYL